MANYFSLFCVLTTLFVLSYGHPTVTEKDKNEIKCLEGEVLDTTGKCVKVPAVVPKPKPTLSPEEKAKRMEMKKVRKQKKRTIRKKLDEEIKEIKRLVFEGLEKGTIDLKCPDGKEINEQGECAEASPVIVEVPLDEKKAQKARKMEKRLEKELEKVLKKEIQMEMRAKKRREQKKEKNLKKKEAGANNAVPKPGNADLMKAEGIDHIAANEKPAETKNEETVAGSGVPKELSDLVTPGRLI